MYGIYREGSTGGITPHDMGEQLVDDSTRANKRFRAYVTNWNWKVGLVVRTSRRVVRIANIDTGNLLTTGNSLSLSMVRPTTRSGTPGPGWPGTATGPSGPTCTSRRWTQ